MARTKTDVSNIPKTREELEICVLAVNEGELRFAEEMDTMNREIIEIREKHRNDLAMVEQVVKREKHRAEMWALTHPEAFEGKKSLVLTHGTIGFRKGMPELKTVKGVTWASVLEALKSKGQIAYIRTKEEVNKELLLQDRDAIRPEALAEVGLQVDQAEKFYVEPKAE